MHEKIEYTVWTPLSRLRHGKGTQYQNERGRYMTNRQ